MKNKIYLRLNWAEYNISKIKAEMILNEFRKELKNVLAIKRAETSNAYHTLCECVDASTGNCGYDMIRAEMRKSFESTLKSFYLVSDAKLDELVFKAFQTLENECKHLNQGFSTYL